MLLSIIATDEVFKNGKLFDKHLNIVVPYLVGGSIEWMEEVRSI